MPPTPEIHPFEPFVPPNCRVLMLGTFPPKPNRWRMPFYYPNFQNDMWRIMGLIWKGNKDYFIDVINKEFRLDLIRQFCNEIGLGLSDTAVEVIRLKDNASDKFLQIVRNVDIDGLLAKAPDCHSLVATGELAANQLSALVDGPTLKTGIPETVTYRGRQLTLWRGPSSSRAYPLPLSKKAEIYANILSLNPNY